MTASLILCATQRLARNLQLADSARQVATGVAVWPTLAALTVDAWLARLGEQIALTGAVSVTEVPARVLSPFEEALVWRRVITAALEDEALFDLDALAQTAAEAHALAHNWHLSLDAADTVDGGQHEELRRFRHWRRAFVDTCRRQDWLDAARYRAHVCEWIEQGHGVLPESVRFVGFDAPSPQVRHLAAALVARGVAFEWQEAEAACPAQTVIACKDAEAECRAAAEWARARLEQNPAARLGIVVADLEQRRALLAPILDDVLQPDQLLQASDAAPLRYNLSLGLPLARQGLVVTALELLRALATPQGFAPDAFGALLRLPYWSADLAEADLRARLDARLRERPGQSIGIATVRRIAYAVVGDRSALTLHLHVLAEAQEASRKVRTPSAWAEFFQATLTQLGWPGDRTLSSAEFQARAAFLELLAGFAVLDDFLGSISCGAAIGELARLCREKIFQPKSLGQAPVQVLGMLEAGGHACDALWAMGLNDDVWPPPPSPNPLLPAELQRRHATPGASADTQARFARQLQADLLRAAPEVVFSYAEKDGERERRPSPLIAGLPVLPDETTAHDAVEPAFDTLDDALAPPVAAGETVAGGSGLLKAQALCPAWAYYRYRLGAKALETPAEGLDPARRGTLAHAALEAFWNAVRDLAGLQALADDALRATVAQAVETALAQFEGDLGEPLTPTLRRIEAERLQRLCLQWLRVEWDAATQQGRAPFTVLACEEEHTVTLGRLAIRLVIDRIDALTADGRRIVIDYKTGGKPSAQQWEGERLAEPQLPLYAAFVLAEAGSPDVAAVVFAKLKNGVCAFTGLAVAEGLLPGVKALAGENPDADWPALIAGWREKILLLADEIQRGEAGVRCAKESDLAHCEVRPILRLAERRRQFERMQVET